MTREELKDDLKQQYLSLIRIRDAEDRDREIELQLHAARIKLRMLGVVVENLTAEEPPQGQKAE